MEAGRVGRHGLGRGKHHRSSCGRRGSIFGVHGHRCAVVLEGPLQPSLTVIAIENDVASELTEWCLWYRALRFRSRVKNILGLAEGQLL